jgi:hypothetical protein
MLNHVDRLANRPRWKTTRHRTIPEQKLWSVRGVGVEGRQLGPKNLYDHHRDAVSRGGDRPSPADHLRLAGGDRRMEHSILGELVGRSSDWCARILRLYPEAVVRSESGHDRLSRRAARHKEIERAPVTNHSQAAISMNR